VDTKIAYMDKHHISHSIVSLANPWLDFLEGDAAEAVAQELNDELQDICEKSNGRLYGFATLPVRNGKASLKEIKRIKNLSAIKGVILGTPGAGKGLDHENMRDVLHSIAEQNLTIFLHPHYGLGNEQYHNTGHALFLALGFPFETTAAVSRLIVTGVLDEIPNLKILIAHAGAALPSLIGRLDSCVAHDLAIANKLQHAPSEYMKRFYYDAIAYDPTILQSLINLVGPDRIMFGTDNPFFPPLNVPDINTASWPSTVKVQQSIGSLPNSTHRDQVNFGNAVKLFNL
jgi:predicted TIM-barrel fold metal-dependent hydrolase